MEQMKNLPLTILLSVLISNTNTCYSDEIIHLKAKQPAPFAGVLLSDKQAAIIYGELVDYDKVKLLNKSLNDSIDVYKKDEVIYKSEISEVTTENLSLRTAVDDANKNNFWKCALYFGLGVLTTSAVVYATRPR